MSKKGFPEIEYTVDYEDGVICFKSTEETFRVLYNLIGKFSATDLYKLGLSPRESMILGRVFSGLEEALDE